MSVRLPSSLTWRFGDYRPPPALERVEGTGMAWTESIADRGESRLLSEFRTKPRIVAFLRAVLGAGVQDLHDAIYQTITERWIDTAIGAQLDVIGWLLDLPRNGAPDELYRRLLLAQVLALRSSGTWRDFGKILDAIEVTLSTTRFWWAGMAAATVEVSDYLDGGQVPSRQVFDLLNRAKPAAVRLQLVYPTTPTGGSFLFSNGDDDLSEAEGFGDATGDPTGGLLAGVWSSTTTET